MKDARWNNASITDWLTTSDFTIRFKEGMETGDSGEDTGVLNKFVAVIR